MVAKYRNEVNDSGKCSNVVTHANVKQCIDFSRSAHFLFLRFVPLNNDTHSLRQPRLKDPRVYVREGNYDVITSVIMPVNYVGVVASAMNAPRQRRS